MASQTLNTEMTKALAVSLDQIDDLEKNLKKGMENTLEICKESGSTKLISSCEAANEGCANILRTAKELRDSLENLKTQYDKLESAL